VKVKKNARDLVGARMIVVRKMVERLCVIRTLLGLSSVFVILRIMG
jgi:hypothetical protein